MDGLTKRRTEPLEERLPFWTPAFLSEPLPRSACTHMVIELRLRTDPPRMLPNQLAGSESPS